MRFIFAVLCMGVIAIAATALVIIDLLVKLAPVLIVMVIAVVAHRIWRSRPSGTSAVRPVPVGEVRSAAAFAAATRPHFAATQRPGRGTVPVHRHPAAPGTGMGRAVIDADIIDAEVISIDEDDHRG